MTEILPLSGAAKDDNPSFSNHCMKEKRSDIDEDSENEEASDCAATIGGGFEAIQYTEPPEYEARLDSTFFALVNFFKASVRSSLKPERSREGAFPTEIYSHILGYVDITTQRACTAVSRKFHEICQQQIFVTKDLVLTGYEVSNDSFRFWDNAWERIIDIKMSFDRSLTDKVYITYGHEVLQSIRFGPVSALSFIGTCSLEGYQGDNPWPNYEYPACAIEDQPEMGVEDETHFWSDQSISMHMRPGSRYEVDYSGTLSIGEAQRMWQLIFHFYELKLRESCDPGWERPPHTHMVNIEVRKFFRKTVEEGNKWNLQKASLCYSEIGRPNAFFDMDGTFRRLRASAEDKVRTQLKESKQNWTGVFVLLAVDRSAELYRFAVTSNRLEQYTDGEKKRLKIFDDGDRERVERFLKHIKESVLVAEEGIAPPADNHPEWDND
ncbi:hypothetical protein MMC10_009832 [Thelotrema lepadinum]|nr:hypothetical protein [Thelotrema lepadinum]